MYRLITVSVSFGCEMIRWVMQRGGVAFVEEQHVPLFHLLRTLPLGGGKFVPVMVTDTTVWRDVPGILPALDARLPPDRNIYGTDLAERLANQALLGSLLGLFAAPTARYFYFYLLPMRSVMYPLMIDGAPAWQRVVLKSIWPLWRILLSRAMQLTPENIAAAPHGFETGFVSLETALAQRGSPFLGGNAPAGIDICIAALLAPFVLPTQFGGAAPMLDQLPTPLYALVQQSRQRPAGVYVLRVYEQARDDA